MVIHARSWPRVGFAVAVLSAMWAFDAGAQAAPPVPDGVTLSEQTIDWSTAKYATSADNGFVEGSLDKHTIVPERDGSALDPEEGAVMRMIAERFTEALGAGHKGDAKTSVDMMRRKAGDTKDDDPKDW